MVVGGLTSGAETLFAFVAGVAGGAIAVDGISVTVYYLAVSRSHQANGGVGTAPPVSPDLQSAPDIGDYGGNLDSVP
jgi:hypothetical protein